MKAIAVSALLGGFSAVAVQAVPTVDEAYPYTGPAIPVGDWVDPTVNGNGKGFPRLVEPPAVKPGSDNPTNNINVVALSYVPEGINIHYQTPFGLEDAPTVSWGTSETDLGHSATGYSHTYDRTPPCSLVSAITQCSQYFHEVQISGLKADTTYYYKIAASNGTTASDVLTFKTARAAGDSKGFSLAVLNDMGYTNAMGTYRQLLKAVDDGISFAWHGGDLSYADDWYSGILPCASDWPVCYNGTSSELPGGLQIPDYYEVPLPDGEFANQGGPLGGDMSVLYESNWDLWQQWIVNITAKIPYMVLPGNHEAACSEFDGPGNPLTAYLNNNTANGTAATTDLTYYSCPPSQRNFTAYQNRFRMPGSETGGVGNMWYSFDYGLAHFISLDAETDYASSPSWPFDRDIKGNETHPTEAQTYVTDAGPFGTMGNFSDTKTYGQYQWLAKDLASIDRAKTPWIIAMTHRPMYSSQVSTYQANLRKAFEPLLLQYGVDVYLSGHIHWYERLWPLTGNGSIDTASIANNNTYYTNPGVSMTHIINGMAGNIESHSTLAVGESTLPITAVLDFQHYGFNKIDVLNASAITLSFVTGGNGTVLDKLTLLKRTGATGSNSTTSSSSSATSSSSTTSSVVSSGSVTSSGSGSSPSSTTTPKVGEESTSCSITYTTEIVTSYTTYCPAATVFTEGSSIYTVTAATTLTITNCPCTLTYPVTTSASASASTSLPVVAAIPVTSVISSGTTATTYTISSESTESSSPVSTSVIITTGTTAAISSISESAVPTTSVASSVEAISSVVSSAEGATTSSTAVIATQSSTSSVYIATTSISVSTTSISTTSAVTSAPAAFTGGASRATVATVGGIAGLFALAAYML